MIKLILKRDDIALYKNGKTILDGFNEIRANLNEKTLRQYVEQYIEPTGVKDFNRFLRHFAKTIVVEYLHGYTSVEMSYYLYNIDWGRTDDYSLFCTVFKVLMTKRHLDKFNVYLKHFGNSACYIYQYNTETGVQLYIDVFENKFLSSYLLRHIKSPSIVYQDLLRDYSFEYSRIEIHRYLNRVYESIKHI